MTTASHLAAAKRRRKSARVPRLRKPDDMTLEQWQIALRRQFGREQKFRLRNLTDAPVFSDFLVTNPESGRTYRVAIRGANPGDNFCSCPDFAVNTLGTCKHIEFTLARVERRPGARRALGAGYQPPYSEVYLRYGARRQVALRLGTACPPGLRPLAAQYFGADGILRDDAFARFETFLKDAQAAGHELRCYDDALGFVAQVRDQAALAQRIDRAFPDGIRSGAFDGLLKIGLYDYQRQGALFAARAGRSLIADDMGLGKTAQAIAAVEILARHGNAGRVLVVTPTSLKHQWQQEITRFTDRDVTVVDGSSPARADCYRSASFYKVTNYDVVWRDLDLIRRWEPDVVILDEAQRIKNWRTRAAQTVKQLPSPYAIVLTGTPLENRLEELHSIVEFADRFRLGPAFRFLAEHQALDENGRVVGYRNLHSISQTLKPILIRRTKAEVLKQLPQRLEKHLFVPMTPQQFEHHNANKEIVARLVAKWKRYRFLSESDQRRLTVALQYMRMSCNSTYLIDPQTDYGTKAGEFMAQLLEMLERPEMKVVVFSQWLRTHELLARRLDQHRCRYVLFHGGVPGPKRRDLVARFREDDHCRVFLSTDAGGVGLNLQHASAVLNMDQPWNPAVLEQRVGRVHRLGQHRPVHVVHFVARDTIEHAMLNTLQFKRSLFAGVLDGGDTDVFLGGTRLKQFMDTVDRATGAIANTPAMDVPQPDEPVPASDADGRADEGPRPSAPAPELDLRGLTQLVQAGKQFFDQLSQTLGAPGTSGGPAASTTSLIERDPATGRSYLKLPLPSGDVVTKLATLLTGLLGKA